MNEVALSNNLSQIELEINHHKQIAGQSIWEIGRRLNHVRQNDLVHGQWIDWLDKMKIDRHEAHRFMKVAEELPNVDTWQHLGSRALYLIATMPEEEREKEQTLPSGETKKPDEMTVRELQEVKRELKKKQERIEQLENQPPEKIEVAPADYEYYKELAEDKEEEVKQLEMALRNMPKNEQAKYQKKADELEKELAVINQRKQQVEVLAANLSEENKRLKEKRITIPDESYKDKKLERLKREAETNVYQLVVNTKEFLKENALTDYHVGSIAHADDETRNRLKESVKAIKRYTNDLEMMLNGQVIIEEE